MTETDATSGIDLVVLTRRDDITLRLFAFPHAGGNHQSFRDWSSGLPEDVELVSYSLPGRGRELGRPPYTDWASMVEDLTDAVIGSMDGTPFTFFGHSFGALAAFEVCRELARRNQPLPRRLFLSAHRAPHISTHGEKRHSLPEGPFLDRVRQWGLVPDEVLRDEQLLPLIIPPLRSDLELDEAYVCHTGAITGQRLVVPCVVYGGSEDGTVDATELRAWRQHFDDSIQFSVEVFPGGHFYTDVSRADLLNSIGRHLKQVRDEAGPSIAVAGSGYVDPERDLWSLFQEQVRAQPDALALLDHPRRWSYRELSESSIELAADLAALGVGKGDVVGLLFPHCAEYCISLLTCFGIGAPACLLEKSWPARLLNQFLVNAEVKVVVTVPELAGGLPSAFQTPERLIVVNPDRRPAADRPPPVFPGIDPSDIALISMTSGTSGSPKGVLNTHRGCLYCFTARYELYPYQDRSREGLNAFFAWECLRPLLQGKSAVVIRDDQIFDPVRLVAAIEEHGITRAVVPPSLFESLLDHPAVGPRLVDRLKHMEIWFLMGEVVPTRIVEKAAALLPEHVRLVNSYSTWECLDVSFADLLPRSGASDTRSPFAPAGRVLDNSAAIILNARGEAVPRGGVGELYFASPGVAVGYLNDPVKTEQRFVPCPAALAGSAFAGQTFYRTGDRARLLADGGLEILGRIDDTVKMRGFKVSLRAVESVLEDQPGISRVIVRPLLDAQTRQPTSLVAYLLGDDGAPSETVLARSRLKAKRDLPEYARPRHFLGLDALPISRGDSRKLDLSALPVPADEPGDVALDSGSLTTVEPRIAQALTEVLGIQRIYPDDNFFDLGGNSLSAARLSGLLAERFGISLRVVDVFQFSTLRDMAEHCSSQVTEARAEVSTRRARPETTTRLAVVGMAGTFPGAPNIDAFWENLKNGTDSLTTFSKPQLRRKGVAESVLSHPKWIPTGQVLADADKFDAGFWGIGRREAIMMDPQHRVFIEVAWSALEQAGYARRNNPYRRRTGVFAACGIDGYLIHHLEGGGLKEPLDPTGLFLTEIGNEKDYIATRVAYLLDLGGPALTVASACSSALVALAQAAQSIVSGQCDMAIAGGSSITFPNFGYCYEEGLVGSEDGHVRPFDEAASGTLFGDSVGAIVLKRLDDAIADGDHIWAVVTGFGLSNDGRMKAGYAAPSARAQAQCISDAIEMAGIGAEQISYVECHATATHVGDAIEVKGLLDAFTSNRRGGAFRVGSCAIGSVKGNIGHANCAAGITGFIKTVLCLHHRTLVPTANYRTLNPKLVELIDHDGSPFTVREDCGEWTVADPDTQLPRRAGVSSFGIGGTNAHVIIEEAPAVARVEPDRYDSRSLHLVTVSAKSDGALRRNARRLTRFLEELPAEEVAGAIRALHLSRESHPVRASAVVAPARPGGLDDLLRLCDEPVGIASSGGHAATVAFCFSGQGSQAPGMARGLYRGRADGGRFRRHFDEACAGLAKHLPHDPLRLILDADVTSVMRPVTTQCGLFAVEYAIAKTLLDIGVRPVAVAGHSIGEYTAAAISGVLTLDEASALVAVRAQASEEMLGESSAGEGIGGMLSVVGDEDRLNDWLADRDDLWLAVENAPGLVVLSGAKAALRHAEEALSRLGFSSRPVPVSHPFHSDLMAPVATRLDAAAASLSARAPVIPMASNLTGSWLDSRYEPSTYWGEHVVSKVRWRDDVAVLLKWEPDIILEVGPGRVLTKFTERCLRQHDGPTPVPLATLADVASDTAEDEVSLLKAIGQLWCHGVELDFASFHGGQRAAGHPGATRRRLPTYSFEQSSYWTKPGASIYVDDEPDSTPAGRVEPTLDGLIRFVEKPDAKVRLYCFPFAGGSSGAFGSWAHAAPPWLDIVAVELPGRHGEPERADDETFLDGLAARIRLDAGSDAVALCGLSFGTSIMLELLGGPLAEWARGGRLKAVCIVGRAPIVPSGVSEGSVESYLMTPADIRDNPLWARTVLPILQADLECDARLARRIIERRSRHGSPLVDSPVQVHCGLEDPSFPSASAQEWADITGSPIVEVNLHPGSHDFMLHRRELILAQIVGFLDRLDPRDALDRDAPSGTLHQLQWVPVTSAARSEEPGAIPWAEFDGSEPAAALRFLRECLQSPTSRAALVCPLTENLTVERYCEAFLDLWQPLVQLEPRGQLTLILPEHDTSGLVAGMTRSLVLEEPGLAVQRVYVREWPWPGPLLPAIASHPTEGDLRYLGGRLFALRLLPLTLPQLPSGALGLSGGDFLITGGAGGVGRVLTDWLIEHQAIDPVRIVVSGRASPADLRRGVRFVELDLGRPFDPAALADELGPLAGIFHLAGFLDDGVLRNLDPSRFTPVLAPKVALAQLTELGRKAGAPWVVAFSSTSGLLGAAGQANYAAANAWMDAYAMWSAPAGGPDVVSIDWGSWGEAGMAARNAKALELSRSNGETPLGSGAALDLLGRVIASVLPGTTAGRNFAICEVDWRRSTWADTQLIRELSPTRRRSQRQPSSAAGPQLVDPGRSTETADAEDRIHAFLRHYVHQWDESARLSDLGLDSLDFVRIRADFAKSFGRDIPLAAIVEPERRLGELYSLLAAQ